MYTPAAFREEDLPTIQAEMRRIQLATLVTMTSTGLVATHLPLMLDPDAGPYGTLYGHEYPVEREPCRGRRDGYLHCF